MLSPKETKKKAQKNDRVKRSFQTVDKMRVSGFWATG